MYLARFARTLLVATPLLLGVLGADAPAFAAGVAPGAATPVQREQAQSRFVRGKELFAAGKFEAALTEFNASLDIVSSPNTRLYVGRCLRELGRLVPAYVELGRAAVEAKEHSRDDPRYEKAGAAAADERRHLEPKLGFLQIEIAHAAPTTTLKVGGDEVRRGGWSEPIPVMPGTPEILVETPGHPPITRNIEVVAGQKQSLSLDAGADTPNVTVVAGNGHAASEADAATTSSPASSRTSAYVAGGVAAAGLLTFAVFGLMANATHSDLDNACHGGPCPPGHEDDISAGKTQQTIANIGLGVFAVGAAAAVTLFVLSSPKPATTATTATVAPRGISVRATLGGLRGTF